MKEKNLAKIVLILAVAAAALMSILSGPTAAKSVYFAANHHTSAFDAWNINSDGTVTKQASYTLQHATDPAGVAIHNGKNLLFLTSEFSGGVEIVDPITLTYYGVSSGPSDLAGIDVDDLNDLVYTVERMTNILYIYRWNDTTKQIELQTTVTLPNCSQALGIALDETRQILWVADTPNQRVRAYDLNASPIVEATDMSFTPCFKPVDIAVDRKRNLVYSVSLYIGAYLPPGTGSFLLSKWDVTNKTETTTDIGGHGVGVAVEEVTGYVYVTQSAYIGANAARVTVWDPSTSPFTNIQTTEPVGTPAGIAIGNASFNPLSLAKNDTVQGTVYIGQTFTYKISFTNDNILPINNVTVVDNLPAELDYISSSPAGTYDSLTHTVIWNFGTVAEGATVNIDLSVKVNNKAQPGSTIYNYCTIDSDETPPTTVIGTDPDDPTGEPGTPIGESMPVSIDIMPSSCPNPLNPKDKGIIPIAISSTSDFDVTQVDPATVKLAGVSPLRWAYEDVATPFEPFTGKQNCKMDCTTAGADGLMDLSLKFGAQAVVTALGELQNNQCIVVNLTGNLKEEFGGTPIVGEDVMIITKK